MRIFVRHGMPARGRSDQKPWGTLRTSVYASGGYSARRITPNKNSGPIHRWIGPPIFDQTLF